MLNKLDQALYDIASDKTQKACKDMELFRKYVETKPEKKISSVDSMLLASDAAKAIEYLGCN